jgi:hypothetical protein
MDVIASMIILWDTDHQGRRSSSGGRRRWLSSLLLRLSLVSGILQGIIYPILM